MDFDIRKSVKTYLRATDQFPKLEFEEIQGKQLVHHVVKTDLVKLINDDLNLAKFILEDDLMVDETFKDVIEDELRMTYKFYVQVCVKVELLNLPRHVFDIKHHLDFPAAFKASLPFVFHGKLIGKHRKIQFPLTSRYFCENQDCVAHRKGYKEDVPYPNKATALQRCRFCQTLMQEILEARQLSHYLLADFQLKQSSDLITCKVMGEAEIEELALGQTYEIVAKAIDGNVDYYQCIHLEPFEVPLLKYFDGSMELTSPLAGIFKTFHGCPWSFVHHLALQLGSHVAPQGTFHHLKLGLLLSLAASKTDPEDPVLLPVLVAKLDDSEFPLAIMHYALSLIEDPQPILHAEASALTTQLDRREAKVYSGSLLRAKDTICYLGDMTRFKKDTLDSIKSVLESGQIVVPPTEDQAMCYPLMATIWGHCSTSKNGKAKGKAARLNHFCQTMKPFVDVFGTVFLCHESEADTPALIHHLLSQAMGNQISDADQEFHLGLKLLLQQVRPCSLSVDPEALLLLKKYFVGSRRARNLHDHGSTQTQDNMPLRALQTLTSMAESHAKLSMRSKVSIFDAVAAIKIYEENMVDLHGSSAMISATQVEDEQQNYNEQMISFWSQLEKSLEHLVGDLSGLFSNASETVTEE